MALLPSNQKDQMKVAVGMVALMLAGVYYMYVYSPKNEQLDKIRTHVASLEKANDAAKRDLARGSVSELRAQAQLYAQNLEVMRQLVPTGNEVPALLEQVSTAARRSGLDLSSVEPQPVVVGQQFDTYRYKLSVFGSYHQIAEFLTNVGSLTRIIAPVNVTINPTQDPAARKGKQVRVDRQLLDVDFEIQTYVTKSSPSDAPRPRREGGD
jgi:type IV pilus assembly protein PilO